jgi:hypothetical protein
MSITINGNYLEMLRNAKPINQHKVVKNGMASIRNIPTIPPLNTDIRFSLLPRFNIAKHPNIGQMAVAAPFPEIWNWYEKFSIDDKSTLNKKKYISPPGNQRHCGSCWAISAAGLVSDLFVVAGKVDYAPNLSTTYILACYPQHQCQGGDPGMLLGAIAEGGLASNKCVDYDWCTEDPFCSGQEQVVSGDQAPPNMNALIPRCGCYFPENKNLYFVTRPTFVSYKPGEQIETYKNIVKAHILSEGPVQGGFVVLANFIPTHGDFSKSKGVYLENVDYGGDNYFLTGSNGYKGSHAVTIIGWGVEKNVRYKIGDTEKTGDIPYWFCRNSWGTEWGIGGFFKMAMYPFNKISQFDVGVDMTSFGMNGVLGGMIFSQSADIKPNMIKNKIPSTGITGDRLKYLQSENKSGEGARKDIKSYGSTHLWLWILIVGIIAALIISFILIRRKRRMYI